MTLRWAYNPGKCDGYEYCTDCDFCSIARQREEMEKKWLCDECGYTGSDCPYPQENHCELFVKAETKCEEEDQ